MNIVFKLLGMLLLFVSCAAFGFFKAASFERRHKRLDMICRCMDELYCRILHSSGELDPLMRASFGEPRDSLIERECGAGILKREELELLTEFVSSLGSSDTESECSRILLYKSLFEARRDGARASCESGCRLWRTAGVCVGIAGCIFLM